MGFNQVSLFKPFSISFEGLITKSLSEKRIFRSVHHVRSDHGFSRFIKFNSMNFQGLVSLNVVQFSRSVGNSLPSPPPLLLETVDSHLTISNAHCQAVSQTFFKFFYPFFGTLLARFSSLFCLRLSTAALDILSHSPTFVNTFLPLFSLFLRFFFFFLKIAEKSAFPYEISRKNGCFSSLSSCSAQNCSLIFSNLISSSALTISA